MGGRGPGRARRVRGRAARPRGDRALLRRPADPDAGDRRRPGTTSWTGSSTRGCTGRWPARRCATRWRGSESRPAGAGPDRRDHQAGDPGAGPGAEEHRVPLAGPGRASCSPRCPTCSTSGTPRAGSTAGCRSTRWPCRPGCGRPSTTRPSTAGIRCSRGGGFEVWYHGADAAPATIEGGDILVLGNGAVLAGMSERTTPQAVEMLAHRLFSAGAARCLVAIDMPKARAFMHLDTVLTMVDYGVFTKYAGLGMLPSYTVEPGACAARAQGHRPPAGGHAHRDGRRARPAQHPGADRQPGRARPRSASSGTTAATCWRSSRAWWSPTSGT